MFRFSNSALDEEWNPSNEGWVVEMRNFTKHLVDVILVDQIKVTCKDEHSQRCSKGQGVRGIRLGSKD